MPARSSTTSVLRWPDAAQVLASLRAWAEAESARHPELLRLGLFGSYARGDAGVGCDIDLVAIVRESAERFESPTRTSVSRPGSSVNTMRSPWLTLTGRMP